MDISRVLNLLNHDGNSVRSFLWRKDERRLEGPPLCFVCGQAVSTFRLCTQNCREPLCIRIVPRSLGHLHFLVMFKAPSHWRIQALWASSGRGLGPCDVAALGGWHGGPCNRLVQVLTPPLSQMPPSLFLRVRLSLFFLNAKAFLWAWKAYINPGKLGGASRKVTLTLSQQREKLEVSSSLTGPQTRGSPFIGTYPKPQCGRKAGLTPRPGLSRESHVRQHGQHRANWRRSCRAHLTDPKSFCVLGGGGAA